MRRSQQGWKVATGLSLRQGAAVLMYNGVYGDDRGWGGGSSEEYGLLFIHARPAWRIMCVDGELAIIDSVV